MAMGNSATAAIAEEGVTDLCSFMHSTEQTATGSPVNKEVDDYLGSKAASVQSIKHYPMIVQPKSGAAVGHLRVSSTMILTPKKIGETV